MIPSNRVRISNTLLRLRAEFSTKLVLCLMKILNSRMRYSGKLTNVTRTQRRSIASQKRRDFSMKPKCQPENLKLRSGQ